MEAHAGFSARPRANYLEANRRAAQNDEMYAGLFLKFQLPGGRKGSHTIGDKHTFLFVRS